MPTLEESRQASARFKLASPDLVGFQNKVPPNRNLEPTFNRMIRCPLPPTTTTPDSLRQFYIGGQVPQHRVLSPVSGLIGSGGGNSTINQNTTIINNGGGGSTSTVSLAAKQASVTTPVLNQNDTFTGIILMAKSFQLLSVSASSPVRIELYGTADAQSLDAGRGLDEAPPAGTMQNLITDTVLDSLPLQFAYQNRIGVNGDASQTSTIYITITNIDSLSEAVTVVVQYVPVEQP